MHAAYGLCLTRTNWDVPKHRGLTWFVVPLDVPGMDVRPIREINGDDEFCQEFLDEVEIPDSYRVGDVDDGWTVTQVVLMFERGTGSAQNSVDYTPEPGFAPDLVRLATRVGRQNDPVARQMIARSHTYNTIQIELWKRIAQHFELDPQRGANIGALGKLTMGTFEPIRARIAMAIAGRAALAWDPDNEQGAWPSVKYLNSRVVSISGGSNEMQRNIIGERLLGLPREPSFDTNQPFSEVQRLAKNWK
jgi:alkylation response protein AidB-like acyl-CoA dehydrogenase